MFIKSSLAVLAAGASLATAQRPSNTSICDYYTQALFMSDNATSQYGLVSAIVNRAVIGNTSATTAGIAVAGILNPNATYNGTAVNLVPYFSGGLASTNRGGASGVSVNFLDGGGATPIAAGMPASDTTSNQYKLLTHLYEYFGAVLGCSQYGMSGYAAYAGSASMYEVHKFMVLDQNEMNYFIEQVGLSALSFGAAMADVQAAGTALNSLFNYRCLPSTTIIPSQGSQLQSICTDESCPQAANASCSSYSTNVTAPTSAAAGGGGGASSTSGGTGGSQTTAAGSNPTTSPAAGGSGGGSTGAAARDIVSAAGVLAAVGLGAFALL